MLELDLPPLDFEELSRTPDPPMRWAGLACVVLRHMLPWDELGRGCLLCGGWSLKERVTVLGWREGKPLWEAEEMDLGGPGGNKEQTGQPWCDVGTPDQPVTFSQEESDMLQDGFYSHVLEHQGGLPVTGWRILGLAGPSAPPQTGGW